MHEMSLAEGVLQLIEDAAQRERFGRVKTVWLEIGRLSSVEPDALAFCFDAVTHGSIAEGSRLEFIETPGSGWCPQCNETVAMNALYDACPHCGGYSLKVSSGTEMRVKELEVE